MSTTYRLFLIAALTIGPMGLASLGATQTEMPTARPNSPVADASEQAWDKSAKSGENAVNSQELTSVLGRDIRTRGEEDMGRIIDVLVDRSGKVQAAVVELGGFLGIGTRKIAVDWSAFTFETKGKQPQIVLEMGRDQLRSAPEYKPAQPVVGRKSD